ncbi:nickel/cobalt transporter [Paenalcaligenes sp. Me131]|uniref:nickel/cobalt transporter n=1 Tax=Paenalcaligenes sp. Me131 TaxID=3392636 RepID=UPI003D2C7199
MPELTPSSTRIWTRYVLIAAALVVVIGLLYRYVPWNQFFLWVLKTQAQLHRQLATTLRVVSKGGWSAAWPLIGISLLYGVFHAAGPGHGKAVITTYLGTSRTLLRRGIMLSIASSLMQGVVAILLVELLARLLGYSLRHTQQAATQLENISFAFVIALGAILALRSAHKLYQYWKRPKPTSKGLFTTGRKMQAYCAECGGAHQLNQAHLSQPLTWRTAIPIIMAIGLRPCTGAILVLLGAYSMDLRWVGIAAVLAMSIGTAFTVSLLATITVSFKQLALRLFQRQSGAMSQHLFYFDLLGLLGGIVILLLGIGLLQQGLRSTPNPLF